MSFFQRYYRQYGVRLVEHLKNPPIKAINEFELPRGSVFHYLPEEGGTLGIPSDHAAVRTTDRLVMVDHVEQLSTNAQEGRPRPTNVIATSLVRDYHRRHRKLKLVRNLSTNVRDERTLLVANYGLLPELYRYTQSVYSNFYQLSNIETTLWDNVIRLEKEVGRYHVIPITLPNPLPSLRELRRVEEELTRQYIGEFSSIDRLMILSLWRWLGEHRDKSAIAKLPKNVLEKTLLLFRHENHWLVVSLQKLDEWRDGIAEDDDGDLSPKALQKRFLRVLMYLFEASSPVAIQDDSDSAKQTQKSIEPVKEEPKEPTEEDEKRAFKETFKEDDGDDELEEELNALNQRQTQRRERRQRNVFNETSDDPLRDGILERANELAEEGVISAAEYRRFEKLSERYKELPDPRTGKGSLIASSQVTAEDIDLTPTSYPDSTTVTDKTMLVSTLHDLNRRYVRDVLPKDVSNMVISLNRAGVAVTNYEVEEVADVANHYEVHTVRVTPVSGKPSTIRFRLPKVKDDGTYMANGIRFRARGQRVDTPIRKVKPERVALTSYYGKVFVERNTKVVHNYAKWLVKQLDLIAVNPEDNRLTKVKSGVLVFRETPGLPRLVTTLSEHFLSFSAGNKDFFFNYKTRMDHFGEEVVKGVEKDGMVMIGRQGRTPIVVDQDDTLYLVKEKDVEVLGKIEDIVGLERQKAPSDIIDLKVFSKTIPLGVVLAYYFGLEDTLDAFEGDIRRVASGSRLELADDEVAIRFQDETIIFSRDNRLLAMVIGGFNEYKNGLRKFSVHDFNRRDVFLNLIEGYGLANRHLKELELMRDMFIDPITEEILKEMGEPTTWFGLLLRAAELLKDDYSPAETDMAFMRIRGYERMAGAVYAELIQATRGYMLREGSPNAALDVNPFAVWTAIQNDPSITIEEDSNPIQNLKQKEAVTFMGTGGRSKVSMVGRTRVFGENDKGVISEATVDSGDVAINASMTANPNLTSLRGISRRFDPKTDSTSSLVSTSALLTPGADADDPKRVNFISIQHAQGISATGYKPTPLRTGYEHVLAHRTDDLYATTAKQPGKVKKVSKEAIVVEWKDGSEQRIELGRRFGDAGGSTFPHMVITDFKEGDAVKPGEAVAYNSNFFTPDPVNSKEVIWKAGVMCKVALVESTDTFEDSSAISEKIAKEMGTGVTKVRVLKFDFEQSVTNMVAEGEDVTPETILCTVEDAVTADNDLFNEETRDTLKLLSANTPRSRYGGQVERIEVFYNGDKDDMSSSLRDLADQYDRVLAKRRRALGQPVVTGEVGDGIRFDGQQLDVDQIAIRLYITKEEPAGVGD